MKGDVRRVIDGHQLQDIHDIGGSILELAGLDDDAKAPNSTLKILGNKLLDILQEIEDRPPVGIGNDANVTPFPEKEGA